MEDALLALGKALLPLVAAHPYMAIAISVAGVLLLLQPLLRALVKYTPTKVDDTALEWLLKLANLLTTKSAKRGAKAALKEETPIDPETHEKVGADLGSTPLGE